jgi:hypothetical protein
MLKYVKKYQLYLVYIKTATLIISIKPLLDIFQKPDFSKSVSKLFLKFFGVSQVASANGAVSLPIKFLIYLLNIVLGVEKTKESYQSHLQPNLVNRIIWQLCTRFN